ncbi:MAG: TonB-dependent receptor [Bacteroidales bacterium]|nr:TonB-dependent receptor [Bacteroidales bacterium]MCI2146211.1 TonB-dependent receptor [Bacteroidales bacterium]
MKIPTRIFLSLSIFLISAAGMNAQTVRFSKSSMTLRDAFSEIEAQTDFTVAFNEGVIDIERIVETPTAATPLKSALDAILEKCDAGYVFKGKQIVIMQIPVDSKSNTYDGTVYDADGEPLAGALILNHTTREHQMTDANGRFSIVAARRDTLTASFLGFLDGSVALGNNVRIDFHLESKNLALDEAVVVGYGTVKRKDLTTAVSVVSTGDVDKRPIISAGSILQGRAAGVQVIQPSGMPGTSLSVRVRGSTSVQASNEPLYVVDNVPTDDISNLAPEDIESMQVLKDASSSAIYGARAANGVVLITTKHGQNNKVELKFNAYGGLSRIGKEIEALNTEQYKVLMKELAGTTVTVPAIPDSETRYTNWSDELFKTGVDQNYQLSLSNGNDKLRYYISGGHSNQKGIVNKAYFNRTNFRANVDSDMYKWLTINFNMAFSHNKGRSVYQNRSSMRAGSILSAINTPPFMQVWDEDDPTIYDEDAYGSRILNPIAANAADMTNAVDRFNGSISLDFKPVKNLGFKTSYSVDLDNSRDDYYLDPYSTSDGRATKGYVSETVSRNFEWLWENVLTYHDTFAEKHDVSLMGAATLQHAQWNGNCLAGYDLPESYPDIHSVGVANQIDEDATWSSASAWALASFLGRLNYDFDNRYLLTANVRADGSSRFAPGHRWGFFPSVSAAWRISNEDFMAVTKDWMDDLKIRAGWGVTGNQGGIGNYSYLAYMKGTKVPPTSGNTYPGLAITANTASNPDLTWEKTSQIDVGLDLSLFGTRLMFTADAYYKRTTDLLLTVTLPDNVNLPGGITRNDGKMENKGMEFMISSKNLTGEFKWNTDFNISFNRNKVLELGLNKVYYYAGMYTTGEDAIILKEGLPLGSFYGYKSLGVNVDTGDIDYEDISGNGTIGPEDRTVIGCAQPKFTYGFTNDFSWKGFALSVFFQGSYGNQIFNASRIDTEGMIDFRNQSTAVLRRWLRPGMVTDIPRSGNVENIHNSSRFVEDGSYLRLKSLTLSYNLPKKLIGRINMQNMQVYVTGQNLLTFTKYSGYDPEVNAYGSSSVELGIDYGTYPQSKACILGVNFNF